MRKSCPNLICIIFTLSILYVNNLTLFAQKSGNQMTKYNVIWNSPSKDASGVMPVGNGDIGAGVYAIENGDLYILLSKNDAYNYMGDIFKTGRIKVSLSPNPFVNGKPFKQTLDLATGSISIKTNDLNLRIWVDANHPVIHTEINSAKEIKVSVKPDLWKRIDHTAYNITKFYTPSGGFDKNILPTQDVLLKTKNKLLWYYSVGNRSVFSDDLKYYGLTNMASKFSDPYRFNTFGNLVESPQLTTKGEVLGGSGKSFDIQIYGLTAQTSQTSEWVSAVEKLASRKVSVKDDWEKHCEWWSTFWQKSWIVASDNSIANSDREKFNGESSISGKREEKDGTALVSQSYNVFRFLMACQSRGKVPTKFNGGIFTQQLKVPFIDKRTRSGKVLQSDSTWLLNEDDRLWGRRFTFQNQRLLYWPLLASGDEDLMKPFFSYYSNMLDIRKAITKGWFGHEGAYFRENIEPTGAEQDCGHNCESGGLPPKSKPGEPYEGCWHDHYFTSGLETVSMMIDRVNYTGDTAFRDKILVPFAREILLFYDRHYARDANGKLLLDPAQSLETWWIAVNPAPDIAGLRFCLDELLAMKAGSAQDQAHWTKFRSEIPEVPLQSLDGRLAIAPAEKWAKKKNWENGELYPAFPFRMYGVGNGNSAILNWTMKNRTCVDAFSSGCWSQDQIDWAFAGNATEAANGLVRRFRTASSTCRFPLFGAEGPDSCPDFDHFGAGSIALQRMILQEVPGKIILLPAWPKNWDVSFKLHAMKNTTVQGKVKNGKIVQLVVTPKSRTKDVVFGEGWGG